MMFSSVCRGPVRIVLIFVLLAFWPMASLAAEAPSTHCHGPEGAPTIVNPTVTKVPGAEALQRFYPPKAEAIEGSIVVVCQVLASGEPARCHPTSEQPAGMGFGSAAVQVAGQMRFTPLIIGCRPTDRGSVAIPIKFAAPKSPPAGALAGVFFLVFMGGSGIMYLFFVQRYVRSGVAYMRGFKVIRSEKPILFWLYISTHALVGGIMLLISVGVPVWAWVSVGRAIP